MPTTRRRLGAGSAGETLTKEQRSQAINSAKTILDGVAVGWEYTLPPKKTKLLDGRREGSLGSWRPSGLSAQEVTDEEDDLDVDMDLDEDDDDEDDEDDDPHHYSRPTGANGGGVALGGVGRSSSYRRATTPPPAVKRRKPKKSQPREGIWVPREDDSDFEVDMTSGEKEDGYMWESPDDVPTPDKIRERHRQAVEADMQWNEGLKLWTHRRDAWTQATEDGEVQVCESRFKNNPLYALIGPSEYDQIYTKVCLGGAQPPIPINLKHLCNALVEGWKRDDQWPPKPSRPEPSFTRKKKSTEAAVTANAGTVGTQPGKKGREAVKKILNF